MKTLAELYPTPESMPGGCKRDQFGRRLYGFNFRDNDNDGEESLVGDKKIRCDCGKKAVWIYLPSEYVSYACDNCVPRGCSCCSPDNLKSKTDEQGRSWPCIEWMFNAEGFDIEDNEEEITMGKIRKFETGATRDTDENKPDYEGYFSPLVFRCYGEYMTKHQKQADGTLRASDNWMKGIPLSEYMKSLWRHFVDLWAFHRGYTFREGVKAACCGIIFNVSGYLHEILKIECADDKCSAEGDDFIGGND